MRRFHALAAFSIAATLSLSASDAIDLSATPDAQAFHDVLLVQRHRRDDAMTGPYQLNDFNNLTAGG